MSKMGLIKKMTELASDMDSAELFQQANTVDNVIKSISAQDYSGMPPIGNGIGEMSDANGFEDQVTEFQNAAAEKINEIKGLQNQIATLQNELEELGVDSGSGPQAANYGRNLQGLT